MLFRSRPELDAILHLGDYIYEDGAQGPVRPHDPPRELNALEDYRRRYAQYRGDPDLQAAHALFPFVTVWDDHESANNSWRDGSSSHDPATEGPWAERRARAERAYSEWMPLRFAPGEPLYRALRFGDLADVLMLDTRLWGRDRQAAGRDDLATIRDPARSLLGFDQEEWLAERLRAAGARWKVLGQQVILSPWRLGRGTLAIGGAANAGGTRGSEKAGRPRARTTGIATPSSATESHQRKRPTSASTVAPTVSVARATTTAVRMRPGTDAMRRAALHARRLGAGPVRRRRSRS